VKAGLMKMGLLRRSDRIAAQWVADIEDAYVVYDAHRAEAVGRIQAWLKTQGIISTGRWGRWEYSAMEDAIWAGAEAVR
jgi:protoporphyrinogen oxidase